jgi:16S rRNA processing protein RimM
MEEYIYIGKIVNTHGLKGEIRIISDFEYKDKVFVPGMKFYLGRKKEEVVVNTYRHHKNFEMITMNGYNDISEVERLKKLYVYIKKEDLVLESGEYLDSDLIGLDVLVDNEKKGTIKSVRDAGNNKFLVITSDKEVFIPYNKEFVKEINLDKNYIVIEPIKGMF